MFDLFALLGDLSATIKLGWIVFAAWSAAQVLWYRRARLAAAASAKPARKRRSPSSTRRPVARVPHEPAEAENSDELLASLGLMQTPGASQYGVPMSSNRMGPTIIG